MLTKPQQMYFPFQMKISKSFYQVEHSLSIKTGRVGLTTD